MSRLRDALLSGLAGSVALNLLHESARQVIPHAPRVEVIGQRALVRLARNLGVTPPTGQSLYWTALAGDVLVNTLQYATVARAVAPSTTYGRGLMVGLAGGASALGLPPILGLGRQPGRKTPFTQALTVLWYVFGGFVAAAVYRRLQSTAGELTGPRR